MNICIGVAAVSVGACFGIGLGLFQILFLNDFLALDHAAPAVGTVVSALFTAGTAAGAEFVVLDLRAGNLFAILSSHNGNHLLVKYKECITVGLSLRRICTHLSHCHTVHFQYIPSNLGSLNNKLFPLSNHMY